VAEAVHRVVAIAYLAEVAATDLAVLDRVAVVDMVCMALGSIALAAKGRVMVADHNLLVAGRSHFVVAFVVANPGLVEVVAFIFPLRYLYIMLFDMLSSDRPYILQI
jgi:hypothetical protein